MRRTGPTNPYLKKLIEELRKKSLELDAPIWKDAAKRLGGSRRKKVEVNLVDIERNANENETVLVPGIVLGSGELTKPINVAAWKFSPSAEQKIKKAKGKMMTIEELVKENPKGSGVKILT
jgi:large subunit ribosomal protein L18e